MSDLVLIRTKAGRIHRAFEVDGRRLTDEACNVDDAKGEIAVITFREVEDAAESDLCERCFLRDVPEPAA